MRIRFAMTAAMLLGCWVVAVPAVAQMAPPSVGPLTGDTEGEEGESLTFSVAVDAPDGQPADFEWSFGDGTTLSGAGLSAVAHEFLQGDSAYDVSVRVSPSGGAAVTRSMVVRIRNGAPRILTLEVEPDPRLARPVEFWAEAEDAGTDPLEYEWDFGDGSEPETGRDRRRINHRYQENGRYEVTLTVRDEAAEDVRTITVWVGVDLVAQLSGGLTSEVAGMTGPASFFAGFMPTIAGVPRHSVGRLSADQCMVVLGFWDDERRIHVNFTWLPPPREIFRPAAYRVGNSLEEAPAPGSAHAQVHVMRDDATYRRARADAETAEANANPMVALGRVTRNMLGLMRGGTGDNATLYTAGGTFRIRRASEAAVSGDFRIELTGPLVLSGRMIAVGAEGRFTWRPMVESTRTALADCAGDDAFTVASHVPEVEEKGVDFLSPGIEVTFSRRYKPETVTDTNVQVGKINASGQFVPEEGRLVLDADSRIVWFQSAEPLLSGVYYEVRVRGGTGGVLGEQDEPLPEDYTWRFATVPRTVPLSRGQS